MSARWRPSIAKKQVDDATIDDWENDEDPTEGVKTQEKVSDENPGPSKPDSPLDDQADQWPSLNGAAAIAKRGAVNGRGLVQTSSPSPSPQILSPSLGRSLPTSILPPSTSGHGSAPQILRRNPQGTSKSSTPSEQGTAQQRKTLAEREKEYEEARRRIFGDEPQQSSNSKDNLKDDSNSASSNRSSTNRKGGGNGSTNKGTSKGARAQGNNQSSDRVRSNNSSRSSTPKGQTRGNVSVADNSRPSPVS
ncbi:unnamed protein product [Sympodiomycopsis kandeliae]